MNTIVTASLTNAAEQTSLSLAKSAKYGALWRRLGHGSALPHTGNGGGSARILEIECTEIGGRLRRISGAVRITDFIVVAGKAQLRARGALRCRLPTGMVQPRSRGRCRGERAENSSRGGRGRCRVCRAVGLQSGRERDCRCGRCNGGARFRAGCSCEARMARPRSNRRPFSFRSQFPRYLASAASAVGTFPSGSRTGSLLRAEVRGLPTRARGCQGFRRW